MSACTFFGHRDCPDGVCEILKAACKILIEQHEVNHFYVGNHGKFDRATARILQELEKEYPQIRCETMLAYPPTERARNTDRAWTNTLLPSGVEYVPARAAITWRNKWMVDHADYVVAYVTRALGGAFRAVEYAKKRGKPVINIADRAEKISHP